MELIKKNKLVLAILIGVAFLVLWFVFVSSVRDVMISSSQNINYDSASNQSQENDQIDCSGENSDSPLCRERSDALIQIRINKDLREKLISLNVESWGNPKFDNLLKMISEAEDLFSKEYFGSSAIKYREINSDLVDLVSTSEGLIENYLKDGFDYLDSERSQDAIDEFERALLIQSDNSDALNGISKAKVLDELLSIMDEISIHISIGELNEASLKMKQAMELDQENQKLIKLQSSLQEMLENAAFNRYITEGYSFLDRDLFDNAIKSFESALALNPESKSAKTGLFETNVKYRNARVKNFYEHAKDMEKKENWSSAKESYEQILLIDDNNADAKIGRARIEQYISIEEQMDRYISKPERLSSRDVMIEVLKFESRLNNLMLGPRMNEKFDKIKSLIEDLSMKYQIILFSDGKSEVSIKRAGSLGKFSEISIALRPGEYTFIAKRSGYKTVLKTILITNEESLEIYCNEKILR